MSKTDFFKTVQIYVETWRLLCYTFQDNVVRGIILENQRIIQVEEKVPLSLFVPLSIQHMFAMFGASVMVPFLFQINPSVVLLMNGIGTLLFILITKGKAPAYLGSSFAFLAPAGLVISKWGCDGPCCGTHRS
jgi:xanthine/uracil permease